MSRCQCHNQILADHYYARYTEIKQSDLIQLLVLQFSVAYLGSYTMLKFVQYSSDSPCFRDNFLYKIKHSYLVQLLVLYFSVAYLGMLLNYA